MKKGRLEAFSDGVIAIIITIMVLELHIPEEAELAALRPILPTFFSYALSFVFVGIYWNNHHHLFQASEDVDGRVLWANLHLLFWLSLIPFITGWLGKSNFAPGPVALYGFILLLSAVAYFFLTQSLLALHGPDSLLAKALGQDFKGKLSVILYILGVFMAFVNVWAANGLYILVAIIWLVPDRRIEKIIRS